MGQRGNRGDRRAGKRLGSNCRQHTVGRRACIGVAVVVAAAVIEFARVMDGDVRGRSAVTTPQLRAGRISPWGTIGRLFQPVHAISSRPTTGLLRRLRKPIIPRIMPEPGISEPELEAAVAALVVSTARQ